MLLTGLVLNIWKVKPLGKEYISSYLSHLNKNWFPQIFLYARHSDDANDDNGVD